ncbi:MAG: MFS transporter, partial [Thermoplasmata archaeon]
GFFILISFLIMGTFMIILGIYNSIFMAIISTLLIGFSYGLISLPTSVLIQTKSPKESIGLISGSFYSIIEIPPIISSFTAGILIFWYSIRSIILSFGILSIILFIVFILLFKDLRNVKY